MREPGMALMVAGSMSVGSIIVGLEAQPPWSYMIVGLGFLAILIALLTLVQSRKMRSIQDKR